MANEKTKTSKQEQQERFQRVVIAAMIFSFPIAIALFSRVPFGIVIALLDIVALLLFFYWYERRLRKPKAVCVE